MTPAVFPGLPTALLEARGAAWTAREIAQQPAVWTQLAGLMAGERARIDAFLAPLVADPMLRIVLTGAGTSAFIGECLAPALIARRCGAGRDRGEAVLRRASSARGRESLVPRPAAPSPVSAAA